MKRICWLCGQEKLLNDFPRDKNRLEGRAYRCKTCDREAKRLKNHLPEEKERSKRYQKSERGAENRRLRQRRDYWVNRHKYTAKRMVEALVNSGDMIKQPCEKCGEVKVVGHHPDYAKPLEVVWLCQKHHSEVHRKN